MSTRPYVIRQGDYLTRLARRLGFDADAVWNHDDNRALRERRPNREILQPGDILHVPAPDEPRGAHVSPRSVNRYKAHVERVEVRLALGEAANGRLAGKRYQVHGMGPPLLGTTDGNGVATFSVPVHIRELRLVLDEGGHAYQLMIGEMDPVDEPSGVRKRLVHLGHLAARAPGSEGGDESAMERAIRAFQAASQLPITGDIDQPTRDALVRAHGS
jgi:hypothetical protein